MKTLNNLAPATGRSPVSLDAVDIALLLTYCMAWLAAIAGVALY